MPAIGKDSSLYGRQDAVRIRWPAWTSSFSRNLRAPKRWRGKTGGPACVWKGPSQPHRPLLTPSAAPHSRVQPSGLVSALTGWLTSPVYKRAAFTVGPWNVPAWEWGEAGRGRFREWRHNAIYLFARYVGACHFINICISFLAPWANSGLVWGTNTSPKSVTVRWRRVMWLANTCKT